HGMIGVDRICYWQAPLYIAIQSIWYRLFPFSVESMRVLSVVAGFMGLLCWYVFLKRLSGDTAAATLLFALMACEYTCDRAVSFGRPDALSFAFQAAAFASYVALRETRLNLALLLSSTCVVASGLLHPNGGMLSAAGVLLLVVFFDL